MRLLSRGCPQIVRADGNPFLDLGHRLHGGASLSLFLATPLDVYRQLSFSRTLLTLPQSFSAFKDRDSQVYIL